MINHAMADPVQEKSKRRSKYIFIGTHIINNQRTGLGLLPPLPNAGPRFAAEGDGCMVVVTA